MDHGIASTDPAPGQQAEVAADAVLVGDDEGVLGSGLALALMGGQGTVDLQAGEVGHRLAVANDGFRMTYAVVGDR